MSLFTIASTIFDIYCYALAAPGSTHYGYYIISYEFVYVGNKHGKNQSILIIFASFFTLSILLTVRNMLIVFALFSLIMALINFVTSVLLCVALRKVSSMFSHPFNKHISLSFHSCPKARETWSTETHAVQKGNIDALMPSTNSRNPIRSIKF